MKDQYNREIDYLRLSVTDLCNLKCKYCMPEKGIDKKCHSEILRFEDYIRIVKAAVNLGVKKVRITGGEPLVRNDIVELVSKISQIDGVEDLSMTTNGILLKKYAKELSRAGLNRLNISLDTLDSTKFEQITRGGNLEDVLEGINAAEEARIMPIKLNTVLINGFNTDEIETFISLARKNLEVRFIELMPIGEAAEWSSSKFISNTSIIERHRDLFEENCTKSNGPAKYFIKKSNRGKVGFINPISSHFCSECNRIRLTPDGKLKPCLHSDIEIDLKRYLKQSDEVLKIELEKAIYNKPHRHHINEVGFKPIVRSMNCIGG
ncbi:MAG: GTP 3',8-cyclase MoaA [Tissierellales bacterium]|nr:GTP 3',8-cyclase MoaA [Tissierellales bacterium]